MSVHLLPQERAVVPIRRLLEEHGPMSFPDLLNTAARAAKDESHPFPTLWREQITMTIRSMLRWGALVDDDRNMIFLPDYLLEREKIVECPACKGSRERPSGEPWPCDIELCDECDVDEDGQPTGSVKERVIGVACSECHGQVGASLSSRIGCVRCSLTPTPGLEPGSEGTPTYRVGMVPPASPSSDDDPADQQFCEPCGGPRRDESGPLESERSSSQSTPPQLAPSAER